MYDPEAVIQEADIQMARYASDARHNQALRDSDPEACSHRSSVGLPDSGKIFYPEQVGLKPGEERCTDTCGRKFPNWQAMRQDAMDQGFM